MNITDQQNKMLDWMDNQIKKESKISYMKKKEEDRFWKSIKETRQRLTREHRNITPKTRLLEFPSEYYARGRKTLKIDLNREEEIANDRFYR